MTVDCADMEVPEEGGRSGGSAKKTWNPEEDVVLSGLIERFGATRWPLIASHMPGRVGKQCRERWFNHLRPEVKKGEWSEEEDRIIVEGVQQHGTKWSQIVRLLPGRTDNAIKNRYNSNMRKRARSEQAIQLPEIPPQELPSHSEKRVDVDILRLVKQLKGARGGAERCQLVSALLEHVQSIKEQEKALVKRKRTSSKNLASRMCGAEGRGSRSGPLPEVPLPPPMWVGLNSEEELSQEMPPLCSKQMEDVDDVDWWSVQGELKDAPEVLIRSHISPLLTPNFINQIFVDAC